MNIEDNIDFKGPTWHAVRHLLQNMLADSIDMLCAEQTADESQKLRGRIMTIKDILAIESYSIRNHSAGAPY